MNRCLRLIRCAAFPARHAAIWLAALAVVVAMPVLAAEEAYTVQRGDSVFSIARTYNVPPAALADRNGLSRNSYVYAGQRLMIPARFSARPSASATRNPARASLPRSVQSAVDKAPVRTGRWQYIVLHHSDVDSGTVKSMDKYHREVRHMENGLAYHFVIGNGHGMGDGEIAPSRRWTQQLDGGHLASEAQNKIAIGICLVGNFEEHRPTPKQLESLRALVQALMVRCQLTPRAVKTHQQINIVHTRCPGAKFPAGDFLASLRSPG